MGIAQRWRESRRSAPIVAPTPDPGCDVSGAVEPHRIADAPLSAELLTPIAGVTVEQYVAVSKGVAAYNYDQSTLPIVAAELGIDAIAWETAAAGFNARVAISPAFARHFNALYRNARTRVS